MLEGCPTSVLFRAASAISVSLWVGALWSGSVSADTPARGDDLTLQEIVVSATRVGEESMQKIPMAISVISPAALDAKGLSGISDFVGELPSVNMQSVSPGENVIDMRGLVTSALDPTNAQIRSLVALYLDDSSIGMEGFNPDLHVYDLERVEVIRGPQGTLYGAGSMAGTIRLITKKPDPTAFLGDADLSVSETQHGGTNTSIRGMVNLPLIDDKLAARLVLYRSDDSGYIDNVELGERDANPAYATQGRLAVRWLPSDTFTLDVSALFARLNAQGRNTVYPQLGAYTYESLTPEQLSDYFKLYNVTADWNLSFAHLISSSSYTQRQITEDERKRSMSTSSLQACGSRRAIRTATKSVSSSRSCGWYRARIRLCDGSLESTSSATRDSIPRIWSRRASIPRSAPRSAIPPSIRKPHMGRPRPIRRSTEPSIWSSGSSRCSARRRIRSCRGST